MKKILQSKSTAELQEKIRELFVDFRTWLQAEGELSLILGFVFGILFISFVKFFLLLAVLLAIGFSLWWVWLDKKT